MVPPVLCSRGGVIHAPDRGLCLKKIFFDICLEGLGIINKNLSKACRLEKVWKQTTAGQNSRLIKCESHLV